MPAPASYDYAVIRVTPRVEREEFINAGVILYCRARRFLGAKIKLEVARLRVLAPAIDIDAVQTQLSLIPRLCAGEGPVGQLGQAEVFHWLVAPHSTVIQCSPVHSGLTTDPAATLAHLVRMSVGE